jgi:hypothetical protein
MTDTTILPNVPGYVQIQGSNHHGYGYGLTEKDRMHLSSDALNDALRDTVKDIALVGLTVEKTGAAGQLSTEKTAAAIQLASSLAFANTQNLLVSGFKDSHYEAFQNAASIKAQIAECCCEIKELVREDGEKTRSLVSTLDNQRLALDLSDAKTEIQFLKLSVKKAV